MTNGLQGDGAIQSYYNDSMNAEVSYQTAGIGAETSSGGVRLNMIPREGGNRFSGDFKAVSRPGLVAVEQPDRPAPGQGPDRRQRHRPHRRLLAGDGRADQEGQAVVLRAPPATTR